MMMLILDPATAATVTGPTVNGAELEPRLLADGDFALPDRVLTDPNHAQHHALLATMPLRPLAECVWPEEEDE